MRARSVVVQTAKWCGAFVVVAAALPLLALAGFLARGMVIVAGLAGALGLLLLCGLHGGLRDRLGRALGVIGPRDPGLHLLV